MTDTLSRQWVMLRELPRSPRSIDCQTLKTRLASLGYEVTTRTIQRDLNALSGIFPLVNDGEKRQGWSWLAEGGEIGIVGMDAHEALTLKLVQGHLDDLLPPVTLQRLAPYFATADKVLEGQAGGLAHWPNQVRLLPKGQPLLPPPIDPAVQDAVYQALLAGRQLQVSYRPREATETKSYPVHPLALVVRNQVSYLVCTLRDYPQIRQLLLHRMLSAQQLSDLATPQPDFDLDQYIAAGNFGFSHGGMVRLHAVFDASAVLTLAETPLSEDQILSPQADGTILLSACVNDTGELDTWLHGFGKLCREWRKQAVDASP